MKQSRGAGLVVLITSIILLPTTCRALDDPASRETLRGLSAVLVLVEKLPEFVELGGLHDTDIQTDVELKLRLAGIKVLTEQDRNENPGAPYLYIHLNAIPNGELYAYALDLSMNQIVQLQRNTSITCMGLTWSKAEVGTIGRNRLPRVREFVKEKVDQFLNAYLSVNPKK